MKAMISASAARSTSDTKSLRPLDVTVRDSRRFRLRTMTSPARRAALTAILRRGCTILKLLGKRVAYQMKSTDIRVVLVEPSHPGNIGAVARAMKNMALEQLVLVRPKQFPHSEATARASGADDVLERARVADSVAAALDGCGFVAATTAR